jgi:cobalt-zinc-cadmium efflux system protein
MRGSHESRVRATRVAFCLTLLLIAAEFIGGTLAHSQGLTSAAWHDLVDIPMLVASLIASYLEQQPPSVRRTYGYRRAGVLAALLNGGIFTAVAFFILWGAYGHLVSPSPVSAPIMLIVGAIALLINGINTIGLAGERQDLNVRALFVNSLCDVGLSVGVILGAFVIRITGQNLMDPLIAVIIACLMFWSSGRIVVESVGILLEGVPKDIDLLLVESSLLQVPGVMGIHDLHIWSLGSRRSAFSCHVEVSSMTVAETEPLLKTLRELLATKFDITHCVMQPEVSPGCELEGIKIPLGESEGVAGEPEEDPRLLSSAEDGQL